MSEHLCTREVGNTTQTQPRRGGHNKATQQRPYVIPSTLSNDTIVFNAVVRKVGGGNIYLRRYANREEAMQACLEFIHTGIKPEKNGGRTLVAKPRKAIIKAVRKLASGESRYDVTGRDGHEQPFETVGTYETREMAEEAIKRFEETGRRDAIKRAAGEPRARRPRAMRAPAPRKIIPIRTDTQQARIDALKAAWRRTA